MYHGLHAGFDLVYQEVFGNDSLPASTLAQIVLMKRFGTGSGSTCSGARAFRIALKTRTSALAIE